MADHPRELSEHEHGRERPASSDRVGFRLYSGSSLIHCFVLSIPFLCVLHLTPAQAKPLSSGFPAEDDLSTLLSKQMGDRACGEPVSAPWWVRRPGIFLGASINFSERVIRAFPVGSAESDLLDWLDRQHFGEVWVSASDTGFVSTAEEVSRLRAREESGSVINSRMLRTWAPIGTSYFYVAWNVDDCGLLTEVFADSEIFHFYVP